MNKKKMNFKTIYLLGMNGIIGSGIFLLPSKMFNLSSSYSVFLIFGAGLAALIQAACFANLSSGFNQNGAGWLYTYNAFGKFPGFEIGYFSWIQGVITIAAEVAAFTTALGSLSPTLQGTNITKIIGVFLIIFLAIVNCLGSKISEISDNISSIIKILVLAIFVIITLFFIKLTNFSNNFSSIDLKQANQSFSVIFYMFAGFSFLPIAASKMNNPEKNLPKALISVIISVSAIYALVQFTIIGFMGKGVSHSKVPLAYIFNNILGENGKLLMIIGMLITIFGVALSVSYSTPYIASSLAKNQKLLPSFFGKETKKGTPLISILITTFASILLVLSGSYVFLVSCVVFASVFQYIAVALSTIKFTKNPVGKGGTFNGKKIIGGYTIPIIAIIFDVYLISGFTSKVFIFGILNILISVILYYFSVKNNHQE